MGVSDDFLEYVLEQLSGWGDVSVKRMFSGAGLYSEGVMFAAVTEGVVYLKIDESSVGKYIEAGSKPFKPFKDKETVLKSYYDVPGSVFEDSEEFKEWAAEALDIQKRS